MAHEFALRPIDDPDRAFEPQLAQRLDQLAPLELPARQSVSERDSPVLRNANS